MKVLKCEMCGSQDLVKDEGVFVCQSCGTKYTVEEAKKMMVEGTVNVKGTVSIDTSKELENLLILAHRAKESDNDTLAIKYFNEISLKDPNNWEAFFYCIYYEAKSCTKGQVANRCLKIKNAFPSTLSLIKENLNEEEQNAALMMLLKDLNRLSLILHANAVQLWLHRSVDLFFDIGYAIISMNDKCGDTIKDCFGDRYIKISALFWKEAMREYRALMDLGQSNALSTQISATFESQGANGARINDKILVVEPNYQPLVIFNQKKGNGCYVATAVYGSYDCPEVWTLRRYRDNTLDETWYGRLFIRAYYTISPTFVRYFGNVKIFKEQGKNILDRWVTKLNNKGYENTPYRDKY